MVVADDVHGVEGSGVPEPDNCEVPVIQADKLPVIAGLEIVIVAVVLQPPPLAVYVIVLVPAETPCTRPVLFTVAMVVADEAHVPPAGVPEPVN